MQNRMKAKILDETFSIQNIPHYERVTDAFIEVKEWNHHFQVIAWKWWFQCLKIDTVYDSWETGILLEVAQKFTTLQISIFAFTSIDHGYFFFEEKFQKLVESSILAKI